MKQKRTLALFALLILMALLGWRLFHTIDKLHDQKALHQWANTISEEDIFLAEAQIRTRHAVEERPLSAEQLDELLSILHQLPLQSITDRPQRTAGMNSHYIGISLYLNNDDGDGANQYDTMYLLTYYCNSNSILFSTSDETSPLYDNYNWRMEDPRLAIFFAELSS